MKTSTIATLSVVGGLSLGGVTQANGGKYIVRGRNITAIEGAAPKIVIIAQFESVEKIQSYRNSPEYKALDNLRRKSSKERAYAVEGLN
jgi:uncharacterized protein (DUF1330 family)